MASFDDDIDALAREVEARIALQSERLEALPDSSRPRGGFESRTGLRPRLS